MTYRKSQAADCTRAPGRCGRGHRAYFIWPNGRKACRTCLKIRRRKAYRDGRRRRLEARCQRMAQRHVPPMAERLWAAGLFEGEGTISIRSTGKQPLTQPHVSVVSTDRRIIDVFNALWPGRIERRIPNSKNDLARDAFLWILRSQEAVEGFLLDIRPCLKTRRMCRKADLVVEDIRDRMMRRQTPGVRRRTHARMVRIRMLNKRGLDRPRGT